MNKLIQVTKVLESNPDIVIVGVPERNFHPSVDGGWSHTVDFHVAPISGGEYTAKRLQELIMSLVPKLQYTTKDDFRESDSELAFGKLYFDEVIGSANIRTEITLTDQSLFQSDGFVDGKQVLEKTHDLKRRVWVRLFPDISIAHLALAGVNEYSISKKDLAKRGSITAKILKIFA